MKNYRKLEVGEKKTSRIALMRLCASWGLTNDQYLMLKKHIYNNYRRRVR